MYISRVVYQFKDKINIAYSEAQPPLQSVRKICKITTIECIEINPLCVYIVFLVVVEFQLCVLTTNNLICIMDLLSILTFSLYVIVFKVVAAARETYLITGLAHLFSYFRIFI